MTPIADIRKVGAPLLETYAVSAGFSQVEALDVENDFFRFYILR